MNRSVALLLIPMFVPALALAGAAEDEGLEIAKEADRRDTGFSDSTADMVMILRNKKGQESKRELEKYKYKYIKDDQVGGIDCFLIERYPIDKDSGYTKQQAWLDKDEYRVRKVDYYDHKAQLLKTFTPSAYKKFLGKYWRAHSMKMFNHQTGKSTELSWSNFKFKTGLKDDDFTRTRLTQVL